MTTSILPASSAVALATVRELRAFFREFQGDEDSLSLATAAKRLDVGVDWIRDHLHEFPNAWRLPAGAVKRNGEGRNVGELRITVGDLRAFEQRQRLRKEATP